MHNPHSCPTTHLSPSSRSFDPKTRSGRVPSILALRIMETARSSVISKGLCCRVAPTGSIMLLAGCANSQVSAHNPWACQNFV